MSLSSSVDKFANPKPDLDDANILITGGTGSFGKAFIRYALERFKPRRVVVFSRDEQKQYEMQMGLPPERRDLLRFFIGDVRDRNRLEMAMRGIDFVIHAAALKHVPAAEYNPFECINTNVVGAENVVQAAIRNDVKKVLGLSTDKAANPINLYGASKLAADKIFVAANHLSGADGTKFSVVRYGNVVGSRGSVVPLFQRMIADGANQLPITDARMTRFWITLRQGVNFVLSSFAMMEGGEIFVPKIPSMKMTDLATAMAPALSHEIIGIRPGEKLHEVMIPTDDARTTVELDDRYIIAPAFMKWRADSAWENGAAKVDEGFQYGSDTNSEWLAPEDLQTMLEEIGSSDTP